MSDNQPTSAEISALSEQLAAVVTDPRFQAAVAELQAIPPAEREEAFARIASVAALKARGIELPDGLRTSPRYFEDPQTRRPATGDPGNVFWIGQDPKDTEQGTVDHDRVPATAIQPTALAAMMTTGQVSLLGTSVCVSAGYGVCVSVGKQY